ncbi:hypothetical protein [Streptomyces sp. NBC_00151]|jgi:hypothetical protein|uniref:hypothetical protein n=1 Tax=Streptomyces sp. NBC_00151 TaxID=2975669 RepID=UPI002DDB3859|nr:hypothetical protein [Streptomyces sp. NBC_00151]WRZ43341.1 hypothetical protein OG915_38000 [Streptomyces sp. NBC_00151]
MNPSPVPGRPKVPGHPKAAVVLATAAVLMAGGCSSSSPSSSGPSRPKGAAVVMPEVSSVPRLITAADRTLPIAPYLLSDEQSDELTAAQAKLTERCMARFGLRYTSPAPAPVFRPRTPTQFRYGVTDPEAAAVDGFAPAGGRTAPATAQPAALSAETTLVLTGTNDPHVKPGSAAAGRKVHKGRKIPVGGCVGEARARLRSEGPEAGGDAELPNDINIDSFESSRKHPLVRAVFAKWSQCMEGRGFSYPDPLAATSDSAWRTRTASAKERAAARADADCKMRNNVVGVWYAVDAALQRQAIEKNSVALAKIKKAIGARVELAAAVLAG